MTADTTERRLLAAIILLAGIVAVALMDAAAKILSSDLPILQINWARFFFHFLLILPLALLFTRESLVQQATAQRRHLPLHIIRGFMLAAASFCFFFAISDNPLPDSLAIFFVEPLLVMLYARLFIGEKLNRRLIISALAGLAGVLIILRPGIADTGYNWTILFSLAAAGFFAGYIVSARYASGHASTIFISLTTAFFGLLPVTVLVMFIWQPPTAGNWLLMALVGILSGLGHTLIILSVRYAAASYVAVLHYAEVPVAALISWVLFNHLPDTFVWAGVLLIAVANLYALRAR